MKRVASQSTLTGLAMGLTLALGLACAQPEYDFVLIDSFNPTYGLRETYVWDLNDLGMGCGFATMDNQIGYPAFTWTPASGKVRIPISYPNGINNTGMVVGNTAVYYPSSGTVVSPPLLPGTYLGPYFHAVNDAGIAVGSIQTCNCSNSAGTLQVPYVWDAVNGARSVSVPNAKGLGRINSAGLAIGWTTSSSAAEAFVIDVHTGAYTMLADFFPPTGTSPTRAYDINDVGEIVGTRQGTGAVAFFGYVYRPSTGVEFLPFPGGAYQQAVKPLGINDAGTAVGEIYVNGSARAFVYDPQQGIRDLNNPALVAGIQPGFTMSTARRVNAQGWIAGGGSGGGGMYKSFVLIPRPRPCDPDLNQDGNVDQDDVSYLTNVVGGGENPSGVDPDFNRDGNVDQDDVAALIDVVAGGPC